MPGSSHVHAPTRVVVQYPQPAVDLGRFPAKRCVGDVVSVSADIFGDGHELLRAVVRVGRWTFTFEAWLDAFATWRDELHRKLAAGQEDLAGELSEGALLLEQALERSPRAADRATIAAALQTLNDPAATVTAKWQAALSVELEAAVARAPDRSESTVLEPALELDVERIRARFGAWYELFPRSWGGLAGVRRVLPQLAELGFDVIYLPPIHPIGVTNRKGANNSLTAAPGDPGSPWAIGAPEGGHDAVNPELGTREDLLALTEEANRLGLEIALDFAIQCSADHPWLKQHPEWFNHRPDGTLKYAENPPKRYQDIYNFNWETPDRDGLWQALLEVVLGWVQCGVKTFRVDNPHTKPFAFWEWLIADVHRRDPDVVFLAEAFTKRAVMRHLAKIGFSQSYTYFTWKNSRWELTEYVSELAHSGEQEYFRPNFFANTPDILHAYLQHGGPHAFEARLVLAATLSPSYGIYSGYESFERAPVREGSEEYLHSEKYELKTRALDGPLLPLIGRLNEIRRENPALQEFANVEFLETANDALIAYAKQSNGNTVITVVNIDPNAAQEGIAVVPAHLGLPPSFTVNDLLSNERHMWRIGPNYVRLEPGVRQAHVARVET